MLLTGGFSIMKIAPVNKIIWFSNVDGPGNRTSVFFQGCSFNCLFCHNPETINLCSHCGACVPGCPVHALSRGSDESVFWNATACVQCDACIRSCPNDASPRVRWMSVEELLTELDRSLPYIDGITVSGGECTLYTDFLMDLFPPLRQKGKTCLIDSNGSFSFRQHPRILEDTDGVMLDVKAVTPSWSLKLVSSLPDPVLDNLDYLLDVRKLTEVRTVIFPGQDLENEITVRCVAERIGGACDYKIIRYRPFGVREQYQKLLGEDTTDQAYAGYYADLARSLGASKAFVV